MSPKILITHSREPKNGLNITRTKKRNQRLQTTIPTKIPRSSRTLRHHRTKIKNNQTTRRANRHSIFITTYLTILYKRLGRTRTNSTIKTTNYRKRKPYKRKRPLKTRMRTNENRGLSLIKRNRKNEKKRTRTKRPKY